MAFSATIDHTHSTTVTAINWDQWINLSEPSSSRATKKISPDAEEDFVNLQELYQPVGTIVRSSPEWTADNFLSALGHFIQQHPDSILMNFSQYQDYPYGDNIQTATYALIPRLAIAQQVQTLSTQYIADTTLLADFLLPDSLFKTHEAILSGRWSDSQRKEYQYLHTARDPFKRLQAIWQMHFASWKYAQKGTQPLIYQVADIQQNSLNQLQSFLQKNLTYVPSNVEIQLYQLTHTTAKQTNRTVLKGTGITVTPDQLQEGVRTLKDPAQLQAFFAHFTGTAKPSKQRDHLPASPNPATANATSSSRHPTPQPAEATITNSTSFSDTSITPTTPTAHSSSPSLALAFSPMTNRKKLAKNTNEETTGLLTSEV